MNTLGFGIGIGSILLGILIWGISLLIFYFIIKAAVRNGNIEAQKKIAPSSGGPSFSHSVNCPHCGHRPITSFDKSCPKCKRNL